MNVHCNELWFFDKHTVQHTALAMVDRASKVAITKENISAHAGGDRNAVLSIPSTGVAEIFLVEAD